MRGDSYLRVLDHHMLPFWDIRRCNHFMQDGDPVNRSRVVKKWLKDNHLPVLECLELYKKQGSGSTFHQHPDIKGSPDEFVGPYICRIFLEVRRIHAKYIA